MLSKQDVPSNTAAAQQSQFTYLGLHHTASSGNVGLVKYVLSHGQLVDAVWDSISALHAAAAGGSEHIARILIESGADVNFGWQPKNKCELKTHTLSSSSTSPPIKKASEAKLQKSELEQKPKPHTASSSPSSMADTGLGNWKLASRGNIPSTMQQAYMLI